MILSDVRDQGLLKWLILGVRREIHEMSLEHLVVPESKKVSKKLPTMLRELEKLSQLEEVIEK